MALTPEEEIELLTLEEEELIIQKQKLMSETPKRPIGAARSFDEPSLVETIIPSYKQIDKTMKATEGGGGLKPLKHGFAALTAAGEIMDTPARFLGAIATRPEGQTFMQAMADPESGLARNLREIVKTSNQNGAMKFIETLGLDIAEDPLVFVGGLLKLAKKVPAAVKGLTAKPVPETAAKAPQVSAYAEVPGKTIQVGEQTVRAGKSENLAGEASGVVPAEQFTPIEQVAIKEGEEALVSGGVPHPLLGSEAMARRVQPAVFAGKQAARIAKLDADVAKFREQAGFVTGSSTNLAGKTGAQITTAMKKFDDETEPVYAMIEREANKVPIAKEHYSRATEELDKTMRVVDKDQAFTNALESGKITASQLAEAWRTGIPIEIPGTRGKTSADFAMSPKVFGFIHSIRKSIKKGGKSYEDIKNNRTAVSDMINEAKNDRDRMYLTQVKETLTELMGTHLEKGVGGDVYQSWKAVDEVYGKKKALNFVFNSFFEKSAASDEMVMKPVNKIVNSIRLNPKILPELKATISEDAFKNMSNALFNTVINKSTDKGGMIDPTKLIDNANSMGNEVWSTMLEGDNANKMAEALQYAAAIKIADRVKDISKFEKDPALLERMLKGMGWAPWIVYRVLGTSGAIGTKLMLDKIKSLAQVSQKRKADDYLNDVDPNAFNKVTLFQRTGSTLGATARLPGKAAKAMVTPGAVGAAERSILNQSQAEE